MNSSHPTLHKVQTLAHWLDRKYTLPIINVKIGMDGIIGLIPGIGDTLTLAISSWIVYQAHSLGTPFLLKLKMFHNIFVDWLVGLIPFVGDIFDIAWQANQKNATLLSDHLEQKHNPE